MRNLVCAFFPVCAAIGLIGPTFGQAEKTPPPVVKSVVVVDFAPMFGMYAGAGAD